jgi:hypothetical protein
MVRLSGGYAECIMTLPAPYLVHTWSIPPAPHLLQDVLVVVDTAKVDGFLRVAHCGGGIEIQRGGGMRPWAIHG